MMKTYTAIGRSVNLASRFERANKELGTTVLMGETTYERVRQHVAAQRHVVEVRGVDAPQVVYELLGFSTEPLPEEP